MAKRVFELIRVHKKDPNLRQDPLTWRWVKIIPAKESIIRTNFRIWRTRFPVDLERIKHDEQCYCCPDHAQLTNQDIAQCNTTYGRIRVTTIKGIDETVEGEPIFETDGPYSVGVPYGVAETVIIGDDHSLRLTELPTDMLAQSLDVCRARIADLNGNVHLRNFVFYNDGNLFDEAASNFCHPRWHIKSRAYVLRRIHEEITGCSHYCYAPENKERCLICDLMRHELALKTRIVTESDNFIVWEPHAARHPFETWIVPKVHGAFFERPNVDGSSLSLPELTELADLVQNVLRKLEILFGPRYLYATVLHNAPRKYLELGENKIGLAYHWRLRLVPRLGPGSFDEFVMGDYTHIVPPEKAAEILRMSPQEIEQWLTATA